MSDVLGIAKAHVDDLQERLKGDRFRGSDWDMHRQLLRCAHATTNGGAGDIRVLSENVGMLTATYVEDRIRQHERTKKEFDDLHTAICPVAPLVTTDADGRKVMPWDRAQKTPATFLTFDLKNKKVVTGGLVSVLLSVGMVMLGFKWLSESVSGSIKDSVNAAIRAQVQKSLAVAPYEAPDADVKSAN